jgi:hypothetical protein
MNELWEHASANPLILLHPPFSTQYHSSSFNHNKFCTPFLSTFPLITKTLIHIPTPEIKTTLLMFAMPSLVLLI